MSNHLSSSNKINLTEVQNVLKKELLTIIDKVLGPKVIVWDFPLSAPFSCITRSAELTKHNVQKMFTLDHGRLPKTVPGMKSVIFICRPQLPLMEMVAENIRNEEYSSDAKKEFHIFFVPRRTDACINILKSKGVYGNFQNVEDFECDIYPLDNDILSMEVKNTFKDFVLDKDPTSIYQAAEAIMRIQSCYGFIPRVTGKGEMAAKVYSLMERLSKEPRTFPSVSQIDHLVLLDRSIDLLSPVVTQLTYEGLIDEIFQIENASIVLPAEKFETDSKAEINKVMSTTKQILLNSGDELYADIRDKSFTAVIPILKKKTDIISSKLEKKNIDDTELEQLKQFVDELPHIMANKKSLSIHLTLAKLIRATTDSDEFLDALHLEQSLILGVDTDKVQSYIEDMIATNAPLTKVLRLICVQSVTNSGLKQKVLDYYKREIVQSYGFQHILTFSHLEDAGLIKVQKSVRNYTSLRKLLRLTVEDENELSPNDISYVHSMYAPLTIRLVQRLIKSGSWKSLNDILTQIPGQLIDTVQPIAPPQHKRRNSTSSEASSLNDSPKVFLVFFLGGCTFAEIAALRFLQQEESNIEFVIATTSIINGNTFIDQLSEPNPNFKF